MLDNNLKAQLGAYLERVQQPFEIVASLSDSEKLSRDAGTAADHSRPAQRQDHPAHRWHRCAQALVHAAAWGLQQPAFCRVCPGPRVHLAGAGAVVDGGHPPKVEPEVQDNIRALDGDFDFEVYMSLSCHNCPDVVQALSLCGHPQPQDQDHGHRRRAFRMRSRSAKSWRCPWCSSTARCLPLAR